MTNSTDWQLVLAPEGGIKGVYSGSGRVPIKRANFAPIDVIFADSDCYCAWQFVYEPASAAGSLPETQHLAIQHLAIRLLAVRLVAVRLLEFRFLGI